MESMGESELPSSVIGGLVMGVLNLGLANMSVDSNWIQVIKGLVLLAAGTGASVYLLLNVAMVIWGFTPIEVGNRLPSATKRFFTSWAWQLALTAEEPGSFPIRTQPSSWMIWPPVAMPYPSSAVGIGLKTSPPISAMSARALT